MTQHYLAQLPGLLRSYDKMARSEEFLGGTTNNLAFEYQERRKYLEYFRQKGYPLLDTLYDKKLYGLIDKRNSVVAPTPNIKTFEEPSSEILGLTYVVDLFEKFKKVYNSSESFKIPTKLAQMKVYKSFENFDDNYAKHELFVANNMINLLLDTFDGVSVTLENFVLELERLIFREELSGIHFTKSGYALSADSSIYHTGLYLDLLPDEDANTDSTKVEIIEDPNFECYVGLAYESGFFVDSNCPWRLVLDIESIPAQMNILNGRLATDFELFYSDVYRIKVGYDDFSSLTSFFEKLHVEYHRQAGISNIPIDRGLPVSNWLRFLLVNRFRELGLITHYQSLLESREFGNILKKSVDLYTLAGLSSNTGALAFIEYFCSQQLGRILKDNENIANFGYKKQLQRNISSARI